MAGPLLPTPEQEPLADQYVGGLAGNRRFYNMANEGRIQPIIGNASLMMRSCGLIECRLCWATPCKLYNVYRTVQQSYSRT